MSAMRMSFLSRQQTVVSGLALPLEHFELDPMSSPAMLAS